MIWFLAYSAFFIIVALAKAKLRPDAEEFYIRGKNASPFAVAFSLLAACVGGSATIGMIGLAARVGTPAFWWLGSGCFGLLGLALFLAKKIRASGALTMPELLTNILGDRFRVCASLIILAAWFAILAAQISALGLIISSLCSLGFLASAIAGLFILILYTFIGGQGAIMRSDIWQFVILSASLCVLLYFASQYDEGRTAVLGAKIELVNDAFDYSRLRYFLLIIGGGFLAGPTLFVCLLSARSPRAARTGTLIAIPCLALMASLITILGIECAALAAPGTPFEEILSTTLANKLPPWAGVAASLGLYSAVISSADSCLMTAAAICANDLLKKPSVFAARASMMVFSGGALVLALQGKGILNLLLMAYDIFVCGLVAPTVVALLAPRAARNAKEFFFGALFCGAGMGTASAFAGDSAWSEAGFGVSFALCALGAVAGYIRNWRVARRF